MKVAIISPIAWRTPPRHYGPWERVVSLLAEGLIKENIDVTLYATADSITTAKLRSVCKTPYEEDKEIDAALGMSQITHKDNKDNPEEIENRKRLLTSILKRRSALDFLINLD